MAIYLESL